MESTDRKIKTKYLFVGLGLQSFTLIFAYLCLNYIPFIGWLPAFFVAPFIFIVGIIFIFLSKIKLVYRFILGFWIIVLPLGLTAENFYKRHQLIQNEIYLIPQSYHGPVIVNFGEPVGTAPGTENKAVVLKVSSNGTLNTNYVEKSVPMELESEKGNFREYYYIDESGNRMKLKVIRGFPEENSESREILVVPQGSEFRYERTIPSKLEFFVGTSSDFYKRLKTK